MHRLAYICSMPHSGSTAFSLFLGTHSRMVGLGGIDRAVTMLSESVDAAGAGGKRALPCTCGAPALECPYWGEVAQRVADEKPEDRAARYRVALEAFETVYGETMWPVDSSKHIEPLTDLCALPGLDLRAFHLLKDVRSLTTSFIDHARKTKAWTRPAPLLALEYFLRWKRENLKIESFLQKQNVRSHRIGYEELCLAPDAIMERISSFLGLPPERGSLQLTQSRSHLIVGNRMRGQEEKQRLRYDHRWFSRRDWLVVSLLLPGIRRYNSAAVYSNESEALWKK
jgi:hypothetical protein